MNFFSSLNKILGVENRKTTIDDIEARSRVGGFGALFYGGGGGYTQEKAMLLSAVYRCVEVISDSVAQLPLEPYLMDKKGYRTKFIQHSTYRLLNAEPNQRMSRFTFIKLLVSSYLLKGNAYAYIERNDNGVCTGLHFIPSEYVTIIPPLYINQPVKYSVAGIDGEVEAKNMIHILNFSYDGVNGISTLAHARHTLGLATDAEDHARGFFGGGCNVGGVLKVNSSLTTKQKQELKSSWQQAFSPQTGTPNGVAILEGNMEFEPIQINPSDSQLIETRQFEVIDICRFFGVSPVKCFDLTKSSYSTVEATNLSFLTDTLQPILTKIEQEFERKLFSDSEKNNIDIRFDTSKLLRADKAALASYYNTLFNIGVVSVNDVRKELDLTPVKDGDTHFLQSNLLSLSAVKNNTPANSAIKTEDKTENEIQPKSI